MTLSEKERARLAARARELQYLGTHFAMNGLSMPEDLTREYARIQTRLGLSVSEAAVHEEPVDTDPHSQP